MPAKFCIFVLVLSHMGPTGFDIRMNSCVSIQSVVNAALKSQFSALTGDYDYALAA
jgi:hypothetical protein